MGQYFRVSIIDRKGIEKVYQPKCIVKTAKTDEDGNHIKDENGNDIMVEEEQFMGSKLMEHSWFNNAFTESIASLIYKNPSKVYWVGDYALNCIKANNMDKYDISRVYQSIWSKTHPIVLKDKEFISKDKFLVNHTLNVYLDLNHFHEKCVDKDQWCIHPLPLLTEIGSNNNGGDYRGSDETGLGEWVNDVISIEDEPLPYYEQVYVRFKER